MPSGSPSTTNQDSTLASQIQSTAAAALETSKGYLASARDAAQPTAAAALETSKEYLASARDAAQPHINRVVDASQPHINRVSEAASNYVGNINGETDTSNTVPKEVPATTAPLESGPHTVGDFDRLE